MLSPWPTVARQSHLTTLSAALRSRGGPRGVVLTGGSGLGKTTLARHTVKQLSGTTRWVAGTETAKGIPLGAFAHLVEVSDRREPHAILRTVREHLLLGDPNVVVGVDDAHLLDRLSATVVHQLAMERAAHFVVTVRIESDVPDAISALWRDGLLTRVDLSPFSRDEIVDVVETVLQGPLEDVSADRLLQTSQGNPLFLRHLVEGAIEAGNLRRVAGVWQLRGPTVINPQLSTLVEARLAGLPEESLKVVELLAFGGNLDADVLRSLREPGAVDAAAAAGLTKSLSNADKDTVALSHPIYAEVIRARTGTLKARRIRGELVGALSASRPTHVSDRIALVALALDSDREPDVESMVDSSGDAMTLGNLELGERLARRAVALGGGFKAALALTQSLSWQGKGREAEAVLAELDPDGLDEIQLAIWSTTRAANLYWMLGDRDSADTVLRGVRSRLTARPIVVFVDMWQAMVDNDVGASLRTAHEVLDSDLTGPASQGWAAFIAASIHLQSGRIEQTLDLVQRGLRAASQSKSGLLRFNLGLLEVPALVIHGDLEAAEVAANRYVGYAVGQQPARAKAGVLLGQVYLATGRLESARREFEQAIAALQGVGQSWEFFAATNLCQTAALLGKVEVATQALARAEKLIGGAGQLLETELEIARGWLAAAQGQSSAAVAHALESASIAAQSGRWTVEANALFAAARFGDRSVAKRLAELTDSVDAEPMRMQAAHAAAFAADDGSGLIVASALWERMGAILLAADAAAQSSIAYERNKNRRGQVSSAATAARLAKECDDARSPAIIDASNPLPLTSRERDIAALVALGLSNKEIADKLAVSVRTVEGHIYRACIKLDAPDRDALARALKHALT
ncbi:helix-turn-helix transcriptional regulator [Antrihabitans sp. YC3-6]|uniref:Helix-turn-helix transcriptional regulator n=1 Tax=Antrihabitans stalagmiti TaxID=2799499 RepID=A0A934NQR7_9NOCA|nr:LuxR C-terminal-related transcriptional regulator [Antrihabitans stalagmiti]MBJ8339580.1 helix-turn-helix transcriptional regulator [Antrihabitans stalagmiti]